MEKGDYVYCIKDNYNEQYPDVPGDIINLKGEAYKICCISSVGIAYVTSKDGVREYWIDPMFDAKYVFKDYFITLKESRKQKIKELNKL